MFAVLAHYGSDGQTEYMTCGIQDKGIKSGGRLIASKVFVVGDYADEAAIAEAIVSWAIRCHNAEYVRIVNDLFPPDYREDGVSRITVVD
ncbi:MAG: hypothetical protein K8U57_31615 [Planctomycetes bacterium]|nr:hypothetical protein [Planctomycetota bacterium]